MTKLLKFLIFNSQFLYNSAVPKVSNAAIYQTDDMTRI